MPKHPTGDRHYWITYYVKLNHEVHFQVLGPLSLTSATLYFRRAKHYPENKHMRLITLRPDAVMELMNNDS